MKRTLALVLAACMMLALCACGQAATTTAATAAPATEAPATQAPATEAPAAPANTTNNYKLGMGIVVGTDQTKDNNAQVDATVATVILNDKGEIVACRLDSAQNKMDCTAVDAAKAFQTKMELGDNYNMVKYGNAIAEWYDQAKAFENYVKGMTAADVAAIKTVVNEEGNQVPVDETLLAGCTMAIADFMDAVVKACKDEQGMQFTAGDDVTLGVAANSTAAETTEATAEEAGTVKMYTEFAAVASDKDGKILATVNDAIQPQIKYTADGKVGDVTFNGTKRELGDDYNMVKYGNAIAEWFAQSKAFSDFIAGMSEEELKALQTVVNDEGYQVAVDEALRAGCTISIDGMRAVVLKALENVR